MSSPKWLLNTAAVLGLLYFVFSVLKRKFYLSARAAAGKFTHVRKTGESPEHLVVVVNGLFGRGVAGRHVVDVAIAEAEKAGMAVVAARLQVCDLLGGYQLFSDGVEAASDEVVNAIDRLVAEFPSLKRVSLLGSSMGGLVLRGAAPRVRGLELEALVCMCSPHSGAPQLRETWWMRWMSGAVPMQCLRDLQNEELLARLGGAESRFKRRIVVGSPHDETVKINNALLNFQFASNVRQHPIYADSKILQQRICAPDEVVSEPDSAIAKRLREAGEWTALVTSGRHNDASRAFQSNEIWGHIIKMIL